MISFNVLGIGELTKEAETVQVDTRPCEFKNKVCVKRCMFGCDLHMPKLFRMKVFY